MKYSFYLLLLLVTTAAVLPAQRGLPPAGGARGLAIGGAGLTFTDVHSLWTNPAGLASVLVASGAAFVEQRFDLPELRQGSLAGAVPIGGGTAGLTLGTYGFADYREQRVGLAYARQLFDRLRLGVQFVGLNTVIPQYGSRFNLAFEVGIQSPLTRELTVAGRVYSPARARVLPDEDLPTLLAVGVAYQPGEQVSWLLEAEKDVRYPLRVRSGIDYQPAPAISLRVGVMTQPVQLTFGAGYRLLEQLRVDAAAQLHPQLGPSLGFGLLWSPPSTAN